MIGQDYFELRSRLDSAMLELRGIATESSSGDDQAAVMDSLIEGLKKPFLFVVVGEVNAEKSTFLNALSGADLSAAGVMPAPDKFLFLKHGSKPIRVPVTRTLEELYLPVDFLRDFNIVDTPVARSMENGLLEAAGHFLPSASLVMILFPAMNPWGDPVWQFLEKIHRQLPGNAIFVLQHSDQREPEEIQSILDYMKRLSVQRFGRDFPIFPVSANRAFLARSSGLDGERLLAESGFTRLEERISAAISRSSSQLEKLAESLGTASQILGSLQGGLEKLTEQRVKRAGVLRTIDTGLAEQAQRTFDKVSAVTAAAATELQQSVQGILAAAAARLKMRTVLLNLFRQGRSLHEIERPDQAERGGAGQERWNQAAAVLENDVTTLADQVRQQLTDWLNVQADGELKPDAVFWAAQRGRFLAQASGIQQRAISSLNISQLLAPALASSRRLALRQLFLTTIWVMAAIALGVSGSWISAGCAAGAAVLTVLVLAHTHSRLLARILADCESQLSAAPVKMKNLLDQQLRDETENLCEPFNKVLQPVREELAEQERHQVRLLRQMENIGRNFEGLEAELGPGANQPS